MSFSLLSWNVENFGGEDSDPEPVARHVHEHVPDAFALFEISQLEPIGLIESFNRLERENIGFESYQFALTQGTQSDEVLVGLRPGAFEQTIFTQKREFKVDNPYLRPGALVTLSAEGKLYNVLFLHLDSGTEKKDYKNRQVMWEKTWDLKDALDRKTESGEARFVAMGDMNTMGWEPEITGEDEIRRLREEAQSHGMRLLRKENQLTFNDGYGLTSNLDHVLATDRVSFRKLGTSDGEKYSIRVGGWNDREGESRNQFIQSVADHSSLYCEVEPH